MEAPERVHPPDEFLPQRAVWHSMFLRQRSDRRKLRSIAEGGIGARRRGPQRVRFCLAGMERAAEFMANPGIVLFKVLIGGDINRLDMAEEARKVGEVPAGPKHQRPHLAPECSRVVSDTAPFYLNPLGVAEVRREDEDDELALVQRAFEGPDPILAPSNRLTVKKARHAVASQAAI